ncbi:MAG: family 16 glycosylhydrolase [Melioribacteraceae bacterium]|nr:family 16 glycosylhydrolase [Melioribacteraceae bacterium]
MNIKKLYLLLLFAALLSIDCSVMAKQFKGAELRTRDTFLYGRFEVSYIPAKREGVVSSFFTYHEISSVSQWNEIDFEFIGRYDNQIQVNIISPGQRNHEASIPLEFNPYADFNTYAFEWTPDYVAWFVNGVEIYRQTEAHVGEINREQKIMMNIWPPNYIDWVGKINPANLPAHAYYDWVSYSSYTPGSGNTGTNNDFTFQWRDDFDTYDSIRWGKGTHTWTGNESDFVVENAQFQDGMLILCLTKEGETGLVDQHPPVLMLAKETSQNQVVVQFGEELDKTSAEIVANYIISGVTISDAELSGDKTYVTLSTQNYNYDQTYNIIVQNIVDDSEEANKLSAAAKTIKKINGLEFPVKVNAGGSTLGDFLPDQEYKPTFYYGHMDGSPTLYAGNLPIANTDIPDLYRAERSRVVTYRFDLPRGIYNVKLHTAENYFDEPQKRVFDITIENQKIADDLDVFSEAGKNTAYVIESEIFVDDDRLDITFTNEIDYAVISGIEIEQITTDVENEETINNSFQLNQNYPNPFNPETIIEYSISKSSHVNLTIYNSLGEKVETIINDVKDAGTHSILFNPHGYSSGVYFYELHAGNNKETKKMVYLK